MAKCQKCSSRKGKRHCPGLDATICSACCGEYRHTEIDCPEDCVYLAQEPVHQRRRMEKSRSGGRHFLKFVKESVFNERQWRFSFSLFVEVYAYNQRCGTLTDTEILGVLRDLRRLFGTIIVPGWWRLVCWLNGAASPLFERAVASRVDRLVAQVIKAGAPFSRRSVSQAPPPRDERAGS